MGVLIIAILFGIYISAIFGKSIAIQLGSPVNLNPDSADITHGQYHLVSQNDMDAILGL